MSADMPDRPDDDLAQAYARSHALAGDRGPAASVRANVLAAAQGVAAEAAARVAAEQAATLPLTPVAPPVAEVGRGRAGAVNLTSWRVRSGAAFCAMLLVAVACWRLDVGRRFSGEAQVALAELKLADPPARPLPRDLPMPAMAAASVPYAAPPPVVVDPVDNASATANAAARQSERDKRLIVAQADQVEAAAATRLAREAAPAPARKPAPTPFAADAAEAKAPAAAAPPVVVAKAEAAGQPTEQEPTLVTIKAAPVHLATAPAMPPSVLQRRIVVAQAPAVAAPAPMPAAPPAPTPAPVAAAAAASRAETTLAQADIGPQRVDIAGARPGSTSGAVADSLKKSAQASLGSLSRATPSPLLAAAERGDVETLKTLLADPRTAVDAPDAAGRTALLHAVKAQQAGAVRLLLAAGADPLLADAAGLTPRAAAQAGASAEIAALLAAPR